MTAVEGTTVASGVGAVVEDEDEEECLEANTRLSRVTTSRVVGPRLSSS